MTSSAEIPVKLGKNAVAVALGLIDGDSFPSVRRQDEAVGFSTERLRSGSCWSGRGREHSSTHPRSAGVASARGGSSSVPLCS
mmetsp:Transcript_12590/g.44633  ORF Transcript_12590/g.44633 Transcript_12590/m.44633 type:complete len:83 (-) Transcript_12590:48-296(-)